VRRVRKLAAMMSAMVGAIGGGAFALGVVFALVTANTLFEARLPIADAVPWLAVAGGTVGLLAGPLLWRRGGTFARALLCVLAVSAGVVALLTAQTWTRWRSTEQALNVFVTWVKSW
jgi:hypothetical protein